MKFELDIKNQNKEVYDYEFLDNQVDLSEKDFLHTDKKERKELLNETRKLGMSLADVRKMTLEEVIGWSAYFQVLNENQEKEMEKARRRR